MTNDPNDVVKLFAGTLVDVESYQQVLADAGIESKILGESLLASFGSAIPGSVELWVHRSDAEKARAAIERDDARRSKPKHAEHEKFPHPTSDAKPRSAPHGKEPHVKQDPHGD